MKQAHKTLAIPTVNLTSLLANFVSVLVNKTQISCRKRYPMRLTKLLMCLLAVLTPAGLAIAQNSSLPSPTISTPSVFFTHSLN
ncbi:MAG: hypothetical protein ABR928_19665, partial [Terracidiphilus sp.]